MPAARIVPVCTKLTVFVVAFHTAEPRTVVLVVVLTSVTSLTVARSAAQITMLPVSIASLKTISTPLAFGVAVVTPNGAGGAAATSKVTAYSLAPPSLSRIRPVIVLVCPALSDEEGTTIDAVVTIGPKAPPLIEYW